MKIGVMNNPSKPLYNQIEAIGRAGFDFVDLTIEPPKAVEIDTARVQSLLRRFELSLTGHTDPCLPWAYPVAGVRQACLDELQRCAGIFSALGATIMNIHPCYFCPPAMRPELVELNIEALGAVVEMGADYGLEVVFENFKPPFDRVATFSKLLNAVPGLGLHLDFGHTHFGRDDAAVFCSRLGEKIRHVHFSDNRSTADHHMPLGVGSINWKKAVAALKRTGYDGTITLEVFCGDDKMLFRYLDLSRNFLQELWEGYRTG